MKVDFNALEPTQGKTLTADFPSPDKVVVKRENGEVAFTLTDKGGDVLLEATCCNEAEVHLLNFLYMNFVETGSFK